MRTRRQAVSSLAAALAMSATAAAASASTIYVVESGGDAWTLMEPATVTTLPDGDIHRVWIVRVQRSITAKPPFEPGYVRTLTDYDCGAMTTRWQEFSAYSRDGKLLGRKVNKAPQWSSAQQATDIQAAYRAVCGGGSWPAVISAPSMAKVVVSVMSGWDAPVAGGRAAATKTPPAAKPRASTKSR